MNSGGKKISASAQRIYSAGILQHGSIPISGDVAAIVNVLRMPEDLMSALRIDIRTHAATLAELCPSPPSAEGLAKLLRSEIASELKLDLIEDNWKDSELKAIAGRRNRFEILNSETYSKVS